MTKPTKATDPTATATPVDDSPAPETDAIVISPEAKPTEAETDDAPDSAITPAETQAVTPMERPLITDSFDYSKTAVTVTYTFLPEDGHPEGRTVLVSLHTTGQKPLFSQVPLREQSEALKDAVAELQERYQVYLPERKVQVEQEAAAQAAAAKEASAARAATAVKSKVPTKHAVAIQGGTDAVVVAEKKLSLFG